MSKLLAGSVAPIAVRVTITPDDATPTLDLTTVASVVLRVKPPGQAVQEWSTSVESQTASKLVVVHVLEDGDAPRAGHYVVLPILRITGGGEIPCEPRPLPVSDPFDA